MSVGKSYKSKDPVIKYCADVSVKQLDAEKELSRATIENHEDAGMLGAPEVLQLGKNFIQLIGAKRCLDVGTFTGASAFAWSIGLPADGEVLSFDVCHEALNRIGLPFIKKHSEYEKKITFHLGAALEKMDEMIAAGESSKWDFAFIDADKENYSNYYDRCMKLLRPGGVILIDNSLWGARVTADPSTFSPSTAAIDACNHKIAADNAANNILLNLGDGTHVVFKK